MEFLDLEYLADIENFKTGSINIIIRRNMNRLYAYTLVVDAVCVKCNLCIINGYEAPYPTDNTIDANFDKCPHVDKHLKIIAQMYVKSHFTGLSFKEFLESVL